MQLLSFLIFYNVLQCFFPTTKSLTISLQSLFPNETIALQWLEKQNSFNSVMDSGLFEYCLKKSWIATLKSFIDTWSHNDDFIKEAEKQLETLRKNNQKITNYIESKVTATRRNTFHKNAPLTVVSPAFQWAQSNSSIYIQIKLSYRWSSPGALSVHHENITLNSTSVLFSGIGKHSTVEKHYILKLPLYNTIDVEKSTWLWGSVGKLSMTLKKAEEGLWPTLLNSSAKMPNMHVWLDMQDALQQKSNEKHTKLPKVSQTSNTQKSTQEEL